VSGSPTPEAGARTWQGRIAPKAGSSSWPREAAKDASPGDFRGANHPDRRGDGTFLPDFQGVIETDDGAEVLFDYRGYGRAYPVGKRQIVVSAAHLSEDERYRWLNESLSIGVGEVRSQEDGPTELVIEWAEVVWEPVSD
jgi:hypothetical protein